MPSIRPFLRPCGQPRWQPTQTQVQEAVAYATTNNLWLLPGRARLGNSTTAIIPCPGAPVPVCRAMPSGFGIKRRCRAAFTRSPFNGGNQDEFLVFRIAGAAVPEPSTFVLLGCGALALAALAWRRRRRTLHRSATIPPIAVQSGCVVLLAFFAILGASTSDLQASPVIYQQLPDSSTAALAVNDTPNRIRPTTFRSRVQVRITGRNG